MRESVAALMLAANLAMHMGATPCEKVSTSRQGQEPAPTPQAKLAGEDHSQPETGRARFELADGTPVHLRFLSAVVSSQVLAGDKVALEVTKPVLVNDCLVIAKGSPAEATVMLAQAKRSMARGGNMELRVEAVRLSDGEVVRVRAVRDAKGQGHEATATAATIAGSLYGASIIVPWIVRGKDAIVPRGTEITAYVMGTMSLDPSKFQDNDTTLSEKKRAQ